MQSSQSVAQTGPMPYSLFLPPCFQQFLPYTHFLQVCVCARLVPVGALLRLLRQQLAGIIDLASDDSAGGGEDDFTGPPARPPQRRICLPGMPTSPGRRHVRKHLAASSPSSTHEATPRPCCTCHRLTNTVVQNKAVMQVVPSTIIAGNAFQQLNHYPP